MGSPSQCCTTDGFGNHFVKDRGVNAGQWFQGKALFVIPSSVRQEHATADERQAFADWFADREYLPGWRAWMGGEKPPGLEWQPGGNGLAGAACGEQFDAGSESGCGDECR